MFKKNFDYKLLIPKFKIFPKETLIFSILNLCVLIVFSFFIKILPPTQENIISYILFGVLILPLIEEYFFRHLLQKIILQTSLPDLSKNNFFKTKKWIYFTIIFTAIIFSVIHYKSTINLTILVFLSGLIYGYSYYKTDSLVVCWIAHAIINLFSLITI